MWLPVLFRKNISKVSEKQIFIIISKSLLKNLNDYPFDILNNNYLCKKKSDESTKF
jgi:hypothetical protein